MRGAKGPTVQLSHCVFVCDGAGLLNRHTYHRAESRPVIVNEALMLESHANTYSNTVLLLSLTPR